MEKKKKYVVSLDVIADVTASDSEVARFLGVPSSDLDHRNLDDTIWWWTNSDLGQAQPLDRHIRNIVEKTRGHASNFTTDTIKRTTLNVGVMYYGTVDCSISIPIALLQTLEQRFPGLDFSVSCYPTEDEAHGPE